MGGESRIGALQRAGGQAGFALAFVLMAGGAPGQGLGERPADRLATGGATVWQARAEASPQARGGCAQPANAARQERELLDGVNSERARRGLPRLQYDSRLHQAAARIACDNARADRMSHIDARGRRLTDRLDELRYDFRAASENITMRRNGAGSAVQSWVQSPGHFSNMTNPQVRQFGGAVAMARSGQIYWVVVHGTE